MNGRDRALRLAELASEIGIVDSKIQNVQKEIRDSKYPMDTYFFMAHVKEILFYGKKHDEIVDEINELAKEDSVFEQNRFGKFFNKNFLNSFSNF